MGITEEQKKKLESIEGNIRGIEAVRKKFPKVPAQTVYFAFMLEKIENLQESVEKLYELIK